MSQIGEGRTMPLRRTLLGSIVATGLILGIGGCGGEGKTPQTADTPSVTSSTTSATPTPSEDPTAAARAKVLADFQQYVLVWSKGKTTGGATYPYEQVMTGQALKVTKSVASADHLRGIRATGSVTFVRGSVVALNLRAKPSTARVQGCLLDQISGTDKKGTKVYKPTGKVSADVTLNLVDTTWKVASTGLTEKGVDACAG